MLHADFSLPFFLSFVCFSFTLHNFVVATDEEKIVFFFIILFLDEALTFCVAARTAVYCLYILLSILGFFSFLAFTLLVCLTNICNSLKLFWLVNCWNAGIIKLNLRVLQDVHKRMGF